MRTYQWFKVSKENPCTQCHHIDWCTYSLELGLACCMRSMTGRPAKNGGNLHAIGDRTKLRPPVTSQKPPPTIDAGAIMRKFDEETWKEMQDQLSASLGVSVEALEALGCAWARGYNAWAYPMKDWRGNTIGIRLRDHTGHKWAIRGSRAGLFYTEGQAKRVYICEGPTDTAAGLTLGLNVVGRPSCLGCEEETNRLLRRKGAREAVIVSDNDGPGYNGAVKLIAALTIPSVLWIPPAKDLREFLNFGGTKEVIDSLTRSLLWNQPRGKAEAHMQNVDTSVLRTANSRQVYSSPRP